VLAPRPNNPRLVEVIVVVNATDPLVRVTVGILLQIESWLFKQLTKSRPVNVLSKLPAKQIAESGPPPKTARAAWHLAVSMTPRMLPSRPEVGGRQTDGKAGIQDGVVDAMLVTQPVSESETVTVGQVGAFCRRQSAIFRPVSEVTTLPMTKQTAALPLPTAPSAN
jgi:hypothetical protein